MPDGKTVRVQMADGKKWDIPAENLAQAQQRGAKLIPSEQPSAFNRWATSTLGVSEGTTPSSFLERTKQDFTDPKILLEDLQKAVSSMNPSSGSAQGLSTMKEPGALNKVAGATEYALGGIPLVGPGIVGSMEQARHGDIAGSMGLPTQVAAGMALSPEARGNAADYVRAGGRAVKTAGKELVGSGPSMDRLQAAKDMNALPLKGSLNKLSEAAKVDASKVIDAAVTEMDKAHPQGIISKADLAPKVEAIIKDHVKIESDKPPSPLGEMSKEPKGEGDLLSQASVFRAPGSASLGEFADALKRPLRTSKSAVIGESAKRRLNDFLEQVGEAPISEESESSTGWSARQIQQLRTKVGNAAFGSKSNALSGPMRAAAVKVYELSSDILDSAADKAKTSMTWKIGNQKFSVYKQSFDGKWENGSFHESPISKAMSGQNADEILDPLSGKNAQWTRDLLKRYEQFGADTANVSRILGRHQWLSTIERFSRPSKYEMMATPVAALDPTFFARLAATRFLTPPLLRWLETRGINPENVRGYESMSPGLPEPK